MLFLRILKEFFQYLAIDNHYANHSRFSFSTQERDSVMLGEISPHHDSCDSKSSSETPPSYNQLNYNENLQRFFDSRPRTLTTSDESSDLKVNPLLEEEGKTSSEAAKKG